jgi:hypothetical protein
VESRGCSIRALSCCPGRGHPYPAPEAVTSPAAVAADKCWEVWRLHRQAHSIRVSSTLPVPGTSDDLRRRSRSDWPGSERLKAGR